MKNAQNYPGGDTVVLETGNRRFAMCALALQLILVVLFGVCTEYSKNVEHLTGADGDNGGDGGIKDFYPMFQDVHVMIFIGFGFLMTFLHRYGFSALGMTFMVGALVIQVALLSNGFWHMVHSGEWHRIHLDIKHLIRADFVAGSVLITFGAVLGKVSPLQLLVIAVIECVVQGANEMIGASKLGAVDMGGSIFVHTFGAYFGLACALALRPHHDHDQRDGKDDKGSKNNTSSNSNGPESAVGHVKARSSKGSDMSAMLGTLFLWLFWPSFNGALAAGAQQHRVVVNTVLALAGCCLCAFAVSALLRPKYKFDMVDVQNATLAGGVAVGSSSDLVIQPWGALLIGVVAGYVSVCGYIYLSPWLERRWRLHDTCGVHNLHGLPGLLGAVGGAVSAALAGNSHVAGDNVNEIFPKRAPVAEGGDDRSAGGQAAYQLAALAVALALALAGGWVAGKVASLQCFSPLTRKWQYFEDGLLWELPEDGDEDEDEDQGDRKDKKKGKKEDPDRASSIAELKVELLRLQEALDKVEQGGHVASP